jgi:predicted chitinase
MLYDRTKFFTVVRNTLPSSKSFNQSQVDGFNLLLAEGEKRDISTEWIAYVLATVWHETGTMMQPVRETFASSDAQAIANLNRAYPNSTNKYWTNGFFGRGYVQLTWSYNYKTMGQWLGIDLYNNPSLALDPTIASKIIYEGMIRGMFTAKELSDYVDGVTESDAQEFIEYTNARRIINGTDKAQLIAGYALKIQKALTGAQLAKITNPAPLKMAMKLTADAPDVIVATPDPAPVPLPPPPQMEGKSAIQSTTIWASLGLFMTTIVTALSGLTPVVQIVLILLAFGFLFWIIYQRLKGNNAIDSIF